MNMNDGYTGLRDLVDSLSLAVNTRFMSPEHASSIWKEQLRAAGIDVVKRVIPAPREETIMEKSEKAKT